MVIIIVVIIINVTVISYTFKTVTCVAAPVQNLTIRTFNIRLLTEVTHVRY